MTTVFAPNTVVSCSTPSGTFDVDFLSTTEAGTLTVASYAALTSRSHHLNIVNTAMMDGSVRTWDNDVDIAVAGLFNAPGNEVVSASDQ